MVHTVAAEAAAPAAAPAAALAAAPAADPWIHVFHYEPQTQRIKNLETAEIGSMVRNLTIFGPNRSRREFKFEKNSSKRANKRVKQTKQRKTCQKNRNIFEKSCVLYGTIFY